ncbi:sensor histidine kinase [Streptomyces uncialis]|uniref:sensor histidine kinase n=1 Tax=Streptomyces uncialis TaxID=1048205 RepID=UPI0037A9B0AB
MRRSKNGPEPSARGNFTPPPRAAGSDASRPGSTPPPPAGPTGGRLSPRNWRVPTRLNAILLIPVLVGLVMGGFQVKGSIDTWNEAEDAEATARLVRASLTYANQLLDERDVSAVPLLQGRTDDPAVIKARQETDKAANAFDTAARDMPRKDGLLRRLETFRKVEGDLADLRADAYTAKLPGVQTEEGYVEVQHPLMEFANELGLGTGNITSYGRTVYAISLGKAAASLQRSVGTHILVEPGPAPADLARQRLALSSYAYLEGIAMDEYAGGGTPEDMAELERVTAKIKSDHEAQVEKAAAEATASGTDYEAPPSTTEMVAAMAALPDTSKGAREKLAGDGVTADNWWAVNTLKFNGYRTIEADLADKAVNEAAGIADTARRDTLITGGAVVLALLTAFVLAGLMARQMSRAMRQLRSAAFGVAEQRLPMLVDQLSRTEPGRVDTRVQPIPIHTTDEIGEVARAFDQVHREAVRLAAEQALLRGNINAIFTNLSRRNQSLIEGQLTLITDLENNEADPDQLENLFRLDHLATRMRRNGENLLILAGEEPGSRWDQPVALVDVLRAAASEVEQYERIELSGVPEADIHGRSVTDLVHLLSELLENATTFSSPQTKVKVTATRLPDGRIMIEIHDKGIGLTPEDFADINHKLANPPTVDAAISQRMGLFVVGRLADRHGIRVQLRPSGEQAGTTSLVMLPDVITHGGGGASHPGDGPAGVPAPQTQAGLPGPQAVPGPQSYQQPPLRTAAELGFDDSRYAAVPDGSGDPDPVGRSLLREERRAAQEAGDGRPGTAEGPGYAPGYGADTQQPYDGYPQPDGYDQPTGYDPQSGYAPSPDGYTPSPDGYTAPSDGYEPATNSYEPTRRGGYDDPFFQSAGEYRQTPYPDAAQQDPAGFGTDPYSGYGTGAPQADQQPLNGYPQGLQQEGTPYPESVGPADAGAPERVGFDRPGTAASTGQSLTGAGLPRRGSPADGNGAASEDRPWPADPVRDDGGQERAEQDEPSGTDGTGVVDWRSTNDERWQRAEQLRKPKAGGVTSSGLPRRVPRANLVEGTAEQTPQGGPQVSRAPEDVRGRLSNLRQGVQRGRQAGSEKNGQNTEDDRSGSGSTYDQER